MSDLEDEVQSAWCIAANVVNERPYGEGGLETRSGTKHFAPGAKVYVVYFYWGMGGETLTVVGRHRKSHRYITLSMRSKYLVNWRVELVYSPHVIKEIIANNEYKPKDTMAHKSWSTITDALGFPQQHWAASDAAKARAEAIVENFKTWHESANITQAPTTRPPQIESRPGDKP
ncbi:MAG TPA: hypothetical protein VM821_04785 [Abditibacteriaceae bacterium]|jgi:hypothetical protein|nr:hypothetical protein [Abditibacteriaceae bacterium]